jgi:hypothetical protein
MDREVVLCVTLGVRLATVSVASRVEVGVRRGAESCAHRRLAEIAASDDDVKGD